MYKIVSNSFFNKKNMKYILTYIFLMFLAYFTGFIYSNLRSEYPVNLFYFLNDAFTITDAENYIKIAEQGYATNGIDKYTLVFFPMFPLMIRLLHTITSLDYIICSYIICLISSCVSIIILYKLVRLDYNESISHNAVMVYIMYPVSVFMMTGLNEAVFMMFLLATVYFVRRKKYIIAGIFGFMVALTRLPGLCVGVLMLTETIMYIVKSCKKKNFEYKVLLKQCLMMAMTLLGLVVYLLINYYLYGDFFKFFEFQNENWSQQVTNPIKVLTYTIFQLQIKNGLYYIGFSNLIAYIVIVISIIFAAIKKVRLSYIVFAIVYFWVCFSASWLLSGARYSLGAFVIFIVLGIILGTKEKVAKVFYPLYYVLFIFTSCLCTNLLIH